MKKLFTLALCGISLWASAQSKVVGKSTIMSHSPLNIEKKITNHFDPATASVMMTGDTVLPEVLTLACASLSTYSSSNGGYVVGTNGYGDVEKAQRFNGCDITSVSGVGIWIGGKTQVGTPDNFTAKIYSVGATGAPGTLLGTSASVSMSSIYEMSDVSFTNLDSLASFVFSPPVNVGNADYFISLVVQAVDDTIGVVSSVDPCSPVVGYSYELWNDNTWHDMATAWPLDIDFMFFPVVNYEDASAVTTVNDTITTIKNIPYDVYVLGNDSDCLPFVRALIDPAGVIDPSYLNPLVLNVSTPPAHGTAVSSGDTMIIYTPTANYVGADQFNYTVTDGALVSAPATVFINVLSPIGISESDLATYTMVPNPANNQVNVTVNFQSKANVTFTLTDVMGKAIATQNFPNTNNVNTQFNTENLSNGLYYLSMQVGNDVTTQKLVITH